MTLQFSNIEIKVPTNLILLVFLPVIVFNTLSELIYQIYLICDISSLQTKQSLHLPPRDSIKVQTITAHFIGSLELTETFIVNFRQ